MYYDEHSFHYWFWKNYLENIEKDKQELNTISNFKSSILNKIPKE